jgi:hypothetical protein
MNLAGFNALENGARRRLQHRGRFIWREHPNARRARFTPDQSLAAQANRCALTPLKSNFNFGLGSHHLLKFVGRKTSRFSIKLLATFGGATLPKLKGKGLRKSLSGGEFFPKVPKTSDEPTQAADLPVR